MLEWRKGYPSEEMIAAHPSRWWLFKKKCNEMIYFSTILLSPIPVRDIEQVYYFGKCDNKIILCRSFEDWSEYDGIYERYRFCLDKDGCINIYAGSSIVGEDAAYFKGKVEGSSVKQIEITNEDADYIWHAETILNRIQDSLIAEEKRNKHMYAQCCFCPMDEDGNKVPWPSSVAPRGFISWVDWAASKH